MKNPRSYASPLLVGCLMVVAACGDDDGPGEFAYVFYVVVFEGGEEMETYFDADWNSASVNDNTVWDPGVTTSGVTEYALFDPVQGIGLIEWDYWARESCRGQLTYSVTREPAPAR